MTFDRLGAEGLSHRIELLYFEQVPQILRPWSYILSRHLPIEVEHLEAILRRDRPHENEGEFGAVVRAGRIPLAIERLK